jgi:nitrogen fixation/metabolism regulation signal transduction histidine kinase
MVGGGDLNVVLENTEKGDLHDLFEGFNSMTRELQKNQAELAEMEREIAWKEMAKQVAHEIKNPLTPMKLALQQLVISYQEKIKKIPGSQEKFDSIFEKVSSTILNQIENLNLIASEFSRFARMPNYKLEEVDLVNILNDTIMLFVNENINLVNETKLSSALIEADKNQVRRIIINLIRNSMQADAKEIYFKISQENNQFAFIIRDNGIGIAQELRNKIFESNFTTKDKGMGLGLKLAKRFLEGIKGSIELINNSESGTTFKIVIPQLQKKNE